MISLWGVGVTSSIYRLPTKLIPWAAYVLEQDALYAKFKEYSAGNPDHINLDAAIHAMEDVQEVVLELPA